MSLLRDRKAHAPRRAELSRQLASDGGSLTKADGGLNNDCHLKS